MIILVTNISNQNQKTSLTSFTSCCKGQRFVLTASVLRFLLTASVLHKISSIVV